MTPVLEMRGVVGGYVPDLPILHGVTLHVNRGEFVTIIGPNGAGKSTAMKAVAGLVRISDGQVLVDGEEFTNHPTEDMADLGLAFVPQTSNIFGTLTIADNLRLGARSLTKAVAAERIEAAYARFPILRELSRSLAGGLSGGQRQMLAVARALLSAPRIIMLDEPSAGLAPNIVQEVFGLLRGLADEGVAVLMVEQNAKSAMRVSDRTYVLAEGRSRIDGTSEQMLNDPEVKSIYLGDAGRKRT
ncbi:ABC transporter ATP-binding protein [Tropicimonas sp. IMCC34011]|uniref:ABC transporter ATP-binding protein n=1 Tax=Tropicimonas sp. IMCC34011 TaxID=2248759 RepID=UPI000E26C00F|nr:ABC transporter ATP-binding protein [Tropicimonas sp. IMCC34011]